MTSFESLRFYTLKLNIATMNDFDYNLAPKHVNVLLNEMMILDFEH